MKSTDFKENSSRRRVLAAVEKAGVIEWEKVRDLDEVGRHAPTLSQLVLSLKAIKRSRDEFGQVYLRPKNVAVPPGHVNLGYDRLKVEYTRRRRLGMEQVKVKGTIQKDLNGHATLLLAEAIPTPMPSRPAMAAQEAGSGGDPLICLNLHGQEIRLTPEQARDVYRQLMRVFA